jgi:SAM-dependent methyltransferase
VWTRSISHELDFWEEWLSTKGMTWPDDYDRRLDAQTPLDEQLIIAQLPHLAEPIVKILDVGSGPLTVLGKRYPGKTLEITATDALGDQYNTLLDRVGLSPPVRPIACAGEQLLEKFSANTFDFAYARNALDHAYDPVRVIENMLAVVKPHRYVVLRHWREEGKAQHYHGLHQWDFLIDRGDFVVAHVRRSVNLTKAFAGKATVACGYEREGTGEHVVCTMRKAG